MRPRNPRFALLGVLGGLLLACGDATPPPAPSGSPTREAPAPPALAELVGAEACGGCHAQAMAAWSGSVHQRAATAADCEACHGPASQHLAWARLVPSEQRADARKGLVFALRGARAAPWQFAPGTAVAHRSKGSKDRSEMETCARCHADAQRFWPEYRHGEVLAQTHRVPLLLEPLYEVDGQQREARGNYGSFRQSTMYAQGVTCSDCHDPHAAKPRVPDNGACGTCHLASHYDAPSHHHHDAGSTGAQCNACHMVARTLADGSVRHDHSFRIPRPDVAAVLGTPDACSSCHEGKDAKWADAAVARWYGAQRQRAAHWGEALAMARDGRPEAPAHLAGLAGDNMAPAVARATALFLLARSTAPQLDAAARSAAVARDAQLRETAAEVLPMLGDETATQLAERLIGDEVRAVRIATARWLLQRKRDGKPVADTREIRAALAEHDQAVAVAPSTR